MKTTHIILLLLGSSLSLKAQFLRDWLPGRYYTMEGKVEEGFITHSTPIDGVFSDAGDFIDFKKNKQGDKIKIQSSALKAFVMVKDSFVVSRAYGLEKRPFLEVIIGNNAVKLYRSTYAETRSAQSGLHLQLPDKFITTCYYRENPDVLTELDRKSFITAMSNIMADKPAVVKAVQKKEYRFGFIENLLDFYQTGVKIETGSLDY